MSDDNNDDLNILICTTNMGNKEPSVSSMESWIPYDGEIHTSSSPYPVPPLPNTFFNEESGSPFFQNNSNNNDNNNTSSIEQQTMKININDNNNIPKNNTNKNKNMEKERFDIIVIGMQEATFLQNNTSTSSTTNDENNKNCTTSINTSFILAEEGKPADLINSNESNNNEDNDVPDNNNPKKKKKKLKKNAVKLLLPLYAMGADANHLKKQSNLLLQDPGALLSVLGGTKILQKVIAKRCPSYEIIIHNQRGEMRMIVLVKKNLVNDIEYLDCLAGNTGIGNFIGMGTYLPNKGGIIVNLSIYKTKLSFVTAHLAAHEGSSYYTNRCQDMRNIFRQAKKEKSKYPEAYDASIFNHHLFVFGDLNFRIQLPVMTENHEEHVEKVLNFVEKEDWVTLGKHDELWKAIREGDFCAGYKTLPCFFPPTFKVERLDGFHYQSQRTPSYTDRILWKSAHGHVSNITPLYYEPCPSFSNSDHKPIRGAFSIVTNNNNNTKKTTFDAPMTCHIFLSEISCNSISAKRLVEPTEDNTKDVEYSFYIIALTSPIELLQNDNNIIKKKHDRFPICHKSNKSKGTTDLIWADDDEGELHLSLTDPAIDITNTSNANTTLEEGGADEDQQHKQTIDIDDSFLDGSFLYISLVQDDVIIGTAALDLQTINNNSNTHHAQNDDFSWEDFYSDELQPTIQLHNCPLRKNGLIQGYLSCTIFMIWYYTKDESSIFFGERKNKKKTKWYKKVSNFFG